MTYLYRRKTKALSLQAAPSLSGDWENSRDEEKDMRQALKDAFKYSQQYYELSVQLVEAMEYLTKENRPKWVTSMIRKSKTKLKVLPNQE